MSSRPSSSKDLPHERLSADVVTHFRIVHPDREIKPMIRRLHRVCPPGTPVKNGEIDMDRAVDGAEREERAYESQMARLELLKWKVGLQRMLTSFETMEQQRGVYEAKVKETVARTETLREVLEQERKLLEQKKREREGMIRCDAIAAKISAKGKSRSELDNRINQLRSSIAEHKSIQTQYTDISRDRAARFKEIARLVDEAKSIKLPENLPLSHFEEDVPEPMEVDPIEPETAGDDKPGAASTKAKGDVVSSGSRDGPTSSNTTSGGASSRLNVIALPFQPSGSSRSQPSHGSSSTPVSRSSTPAPSAPQKTSGGSRNGLPPRPSGNQSNNGRGASGSAGASTMRGGGSSLPSRPSALRSVTTPGSVGGGGNLEEGEVGDGGEEGEVKDRGGQSRGVKRSSPAGDRGGRSTRSRK